MALKDYAPNPAVQPVDGIGKHFIVKGRIDFSAVPLAAADTAKRTNDSTHGFRRLVADPAQSAATDRQYAGHRRDDHRHGQAVQRDPGPDLPALQRTLPGSLVG